MQVPEVTSELMLTLIVQPGRIIYWRATPLTTVYIDQLKLLAIIQMTKFQNAGFESVPSIPLAIALLQVVCK